MRCTSHKFLSSLNWQGSPLLGWQKKYRALGLIWYSLLLEYVFFLRFGKKQRGRTAYIPSIKACVFFAVAKNEKAKDRVGLQLLYLGLCRLGTTCRLLANALQGILHRAPHELHEAPKQGSQSHDDDDEKRTPDVVLSVFGHVNLLGLGFIIMLVFLAKFRQKRESV